MAIKDDNIPFYVKPTTNYLDRCPHCMAAWHYQSVDSPEEKVLAAKMLNKYFTGENIEPHTIYSVAICPDCDFRLYKWYSDPF